MITQFTEKVLSLHDADLCDDCISRQAVLDLCSSQDPNYTIRHLEEVECLPSVGIMIRSDRGEESCLKN